MTHPCFQWRKLVRAKWSPAAERGVSGGWCGKHQRAARKKPDRTGGKKQRHSPRLATGREESGHQESSHATSNQMIRWKCLICLICLMQMKLGGFKHADTEKNVIILANSQTSTHRMMSSLFLVWMILELESAALLSPEVAVHYFSNLACRSARRATAKLCIWRQVSSGGTGKQSTGVRICSSQPGLKEFQAVCVGPDRRGSG